MRHIGIDIRPTVQTTKNLTGIGRYTLNLINAIGKVDVKNRYYLYSRKRILDFKRRLPRLPAGNFVYSVDYFKRGSICGGPKIDIFHTSSYDLEIPRDIRLIVTVHDVIIKAYPDGHSRKTIEELDEKFKRILSNVDILIADSYNTKTDLIRFYNVESSKIQVIYPGVENAKAFGVAHFAVPDLEDNPKQEEDRDFILFVGTLEPRKNIEGLIKAFNYLKRETGTRHKLFIVGMKGWMFEDIFKVWNDSEFKKDIIFQGYVEDEELRRLYQDASVFVYPSFYEGFGFPIIEAFSYGVPVVTSNSSSCKEIAGDNALLVEPNDYKEIARAILKVLNNYDLRIELSKKGIERAKDFTWDKTAKEFIKLFTS